MNGGPDAHRPAGARLSRAPHHCVAASGSSYPYMPARRTRADRVPGHLRDTRDRHRTILAIHPAWPRPNRSFVPARRNRASPTPRLLDQLNSRIVARNLAPDGKLARSKSPDLPRGFGSEINRHRRWRRTPSPRDMPDHMGTAIFLCARGSWARLPEKLQRSILYSVAVAVAGTLTIRRDSSQPEFTRTAASAAGNAGNPIGPTSLRTSRFSWLAASRRPRSRSLPRASRSHNPSRLGALRHH